MTPPDATGTWQKAGALYARRVVVTGVRGDTAYGRFEKSGERITIPLDPKTGGPRGYVRCEEAKP